MAPRLYVDHPFHPEQPVPLSRDQAHYAVTVMRLSDGAEVRVFNGRDGEWRARLERLGKRDAQLRLDGKSHPQQTPPDLWLLFAPLKKARTDFVVEKAVELGVSRICPVQTAYTNAERIRRDRLWAHAVEAAEQCGATSVPRIAELTPLRKILESWPTERRLIFCDERRAGVADARLTHAAAPAALLVGPEGGFSEDEQRQIARLDQAETISLGPRILRAETAVVAALVLWQARWGDWV